MKKLKIVLVTLWSLFVFMGCQIKPTQTFQSDSVQVKDDSIQSVLKQNPVILDVRTPYDFHLSKAPGSVSIQWQDFSESKSGLRGYISQDRVAIARRLALVGVHPDRPVVILGYGLPRSLGEEGRVAWMLRTLGIRKIQILKEGDLKSLNPREEKPPVNANYWAPRNGFDGNIDRSLFKAIVQKDQPQARLMTKARAQSLQHPRISAGPLQLEQLNHMSLDEVREKFLLLDARPDFKAQQEPLSGLLTLLKEPQQWDWRKFYQMDGAGHASFQSEFRKRVPDLKTPLVVFGDHGVESAALAFALSEWGYQNVFHYQGGVEELRAGAGKR